MTGVINKAARQIDLRGRDSSGIVRVTLNPGFNIVDDETWAVLQKNKHNTILVDEGVLVAGTRKTKEEADFEREVAEKQANTDPNALVKPDQAASLVKTDTVTKDPNVDYDGINPATGKKFTAAEKKAGKAKAAQDDNLSLE